ncbi:RING-type E3 ubiquitin transferase [Entamoeba marina]
MGSVSSVPLNDQIIQTEMKNETPDIPLAEVNIKHVVLYSVDKSTLKKEDDILSFVMDCALPCNIEVVSVNTEDINDDKVVLEKLQLDCGMKQSISIANITSTQPIHININLPKDSDIPPTEYILINNLCVAIEFVNNIPRVVKQTFTIGTKTYDAFDVFGVEKNDTEPDNTCVICTSDQREILLLPCRHVAMCSGCYEAVKERSRQCPICRIPISAAINFSPHQKDSKEVAIEIREHVN